MTVRNFEEFLKLRVVKKQKSDVARADNLIKEANNKKEFLEITLKNISNNEILPNFVIDYCYDILIETIRAKIFRDGYSSNNSHEAEVSYMRVLSFSEEEIKFMNELRKHRNGIKYYGKIFDNEYSDKVKSFLDKIYPKLKKIASS